MSEPDHEISVNLLHQYTLVWCRKSNFFICEDIPEECPGCGMWLMED